MVLLVWFLVFFELTLEDWIDDQAEGTILELRDCDLLRDYILEGNRNWEFAKVQYDLRCFTMNDSTLENQNDYDVTGQGGVQINNEER